MRCLDLGCGGGEVTCELAQLVGPQGSVTGIDMDPAILALACTAAVDGGHTNVEFRVARVNDWEEVAAYDLVYSRLLLRHVSRPVELLRRMWAAVRPQGAIIVEDADFDVCSATPPTPASISTRAYIRASSSATAATPRSGESSTGTSSKPASRIPI